MEFTAPHLIGLMRRWWWLFVVGLVVGGAVGYGVSSRTDPIYSSSALMQVNLPLPADSLDPDAIEASESRARTYRQLIWTQGVLGPVIEELDLPYTVDELRNNVSAWTVEGTQFIEVNVLDGDPERAAAIANGIANSMAAHVEAETLALAEPMLTEIDEQIQSTNAQMEEIEAQIAALEGQEGAGDLQTRAELSRLQLTLDGLQQTEADLLAERQEVELAASRSITPITLASPAEPATSPDEPQPRLATMFGAGFGLLIAAVAIVILGYMDRTVKPTTDFPTLVGGPLLGKVMSGKATKDDPYPLFVLKHPHEPESESVRAVRANISFRFLQRGKRLLAVSTAAPDEGKSVLVANLALAAAQAGLRTVLIDANLQAPSQHRMFDISNHRGLTTWLWQPPTQPVTVQSWQDLAVQTIIQRLRVMPSGPMVDTPADLLLSSSRFRSLLQSIDGDADLVIIDTAPVLSSNAALLTAAEVDGVVLICRPEKTAQDALSEAATVLAPSSAEIVGVVLSDLVGRDLAETGGGEAPPPGPMLPYQATPVAEEPPEPKRVVNSAD